MVSREPKVRNEELGYGILILARGPQRTLLGVVDVAVSSLNLLHDGELRASE